MMRAKGVTVEYNETWAMRRAEAELASNADRGEDAEILAVIRELGPDNVLRTLREHDLVEIEASCHRAALSMVRVALASILEPRRGATADYEAIVVGYAISYPGLPSMRETATRYGWTPAKVSKDVHEFTERHNLPRSRYQKSAEAAASYALSNRRRHKAGKGL